MKQIVALLALVALPSLAQTRKEEQPARPAKAQTVTFDGSDLITAERDVPLGDLYAPPKRPDGFRSLIQVRMNFNDKLAQSVHEM